MVQESEHALSLHFLGTRFHRSVLAWCLHVSIWCLWTKSAFPYTADFFLFLIQIQYKPISKGPMATTMIASSPNVSLDQGHGWKAVSPQEKEIMTQTWSGKGGARGKGALGRNEASEIFISTHLFRCRWGSASSYCPRPASSLLPIRLWSSSVIAKSRRLGLQRTMDWMWVGSNLVRYPWNKSAISQR